MFATGNEGAHRVHSGNPALRRPSINSLAFDCLLRAIHEEIVKAGFVSSTRAAASSCQNTRATKPSSGAAGETLAEIAKSYAVDVSMISRLAPGFRSPFRGRRRRACEGQDMRSTAMNTRFETLAAGFAEAEADRTHVAKALSVTH